MQTISPQQAAHDQNAVIIDVRSPGEFSAEHATGAINIPLDAIDVASLTAAAAGRNHVHLICQGGGRARNACQQLGQVDDLTLSVIEGGTTAWKADGLPLVLGKGVISIERQVRIGAGVLVMIGVALGWLVHPGFLGISAFVGAGLTFAGITDFCGMGLIFARMPWNRRGAQAVSNDGAPAESGQACSLKPPSQA